MAAIAKTTLWRQAARAKPPLMNRQRSMSSWSSLMSSSPVRALGALAICAGASATASGQTAAGKPAAPPGGSMQSYARARQVLEASLAALGGAAAVRAVDDVALTETGESFARNQSVKADPPWDKEQSTESLVI